MKPSPRSLVRVFWALLFSFTVSLSSGQGSRQGSPEEPIHEADRDNPRARDQWFMRGRTAPPTGESPAALRYRAYQQKLQMRTRQFSARIAAATPRVSISGIWNPLGPAPLASDATGIGAQDYHQVSGRATAVAVDRADPTGNTVYLGGAHGGVWKSTNAGSLSGSSSSVVWTPVLDYESTLAVGAIAIQPGNGDPTKSVILVGTGEPNSSADSYYGLGILRSADAGQTWSPILSANAGARSFAGMGFSKIAFNSTPGKTNIVVAAAAAAETGITFGLDTTGANRGLYYSQDSGATWSYATVQDAGVAIDAGSATSVVYNQAAGLFYAAIRYHGIYTSPDGITWSRIPDSLAPAGLTAATCPAIHSTACPLYRAELAVVPGRHEIYTWIVAFDSTGTIEVDGGIWSSVNGAAWKQISDGGITNCGDSAGCGVDQGSYNLELLALPNGTTATDLYPGAINLYKCTIAAPNSPACSFLNLTHVYGCNPASALAHVHPDQHALDALVAPSTGKAVMYFANDGGVYRALDGYTGLITGNCAGQNQFDDLNVTLGSMTQFVSFSVHPTDPNTLLGGTQDNGSPATNVANTSSSWLNVLGGDGGYNAISPTNNGNDWFTANPDSGSNGLSVNYCGSGISCTDSTFYSVVTSTQVGNDDGSFYFPYMLDPQAPSRLIVGTCRVWRGGPATSSAGTYAALSNNFDTGNNSSCVSGSQINMVRSLAAGGAADSNGYSKVIYAGTEGLGASTTPAGGRVFATTNAGVTLLADVTATINPDEYPISGIALDPSDPTGQTAFVTIMGFHVSHVFKTTNAGTTWTNFTANLPDAPADAVVVDPQGGTVYVGTDVGVFSSATASANWTEVGPVVAATSSGYLPNVPVTALRIFNSGGKKLLRASTYGRGIWEYNLIVTPDYQISISNSPLTIFPAQTATFNGTLTATSGYSSTVTLSCTGTPLPGTCTPNPQTLTPVASPGTSFKITAASSAGDYAFNVHAVGSDASTTTHDAPVTLHVVDFLLGAPSPASVSVLQGNTSGGIAFVVSAAGSFSGNVTLACPTTGLPAGVGCTFSPSSLVSSFPATVTLTFRTTTSTPTGTTAITISATTPGAPAAKTQIVSLIVTAPVPDYSLTVSNSPVSATVNQAGTFVGTLKALNGYASAVSLSCGANAPPTCTVSPSSQTPSAAGAPFTVTVQSSSAQTYNFSINGTGSDSAHVAHNTAVVFNSLFTFTLADPTGTQTVKAGQTGSYSLTATPIGSTTFPNNVSFSCSVQPVVAAPARPVCSNPQITAGASGVQTVTLTISTYGPNRASIRPVAGKRNYGPFLLWVSAVGMVLGGCARRPALRKNGAAILSIAVVLVSTITLPSCGGASGGGGGGGANVISVTVTPNTATVALGQTQPFHAAVTGTSNTKVTWQVNGITGGSAAAGTIDSNGLYTAPSAMTAGSATVSAVSQADVTKSGSATVTIQGPAVSVSPQTATPFPGQQQQFTATVSGTTDTQVTWQVNGVTGGSASTGAIDSTGLYTAPASVPNPATVTVSALSQTAGTGTATVTIRAPTPSGTFTITVTATSGSVIQTTSATLVVQ
jgi:hypothetical protein